MSQSLNVMCGICYEFYKSTDKIDSTFCGHLFHHKCIARWLVRSNTCPQCQRTCQHRIHRVFLNFGEKTDQDEDMEAVVLDEPEWVSLYDSFTSAPYNYVPKNAIRAGSDPDGNTAYVARVYFEGDLLPANYVIEKGGVYTPYACKAHFLSQEVEILEYDDQANSKWKLQWVSASNGQIPEGALCTGRTVYDETLYTGRAKYENITLPGKLHPSHGVLYMPYKGQEVNSKEYEILVKVPKELN